MALSKINRMADASTNSVAKQNMMLLHQNLKPVIFGVFSMCWSPPVGFLDRCFFLLVKNSAKELRLCGLVLVLRKFFATEAPKKELPQEKLGFFNVVVMDVVKIFYNLSNGL